MQFDPLYESLEAVQDEASFLRFVALLVEDRVASSREQFELDGHQGEWANNSIEAFLSAAVAWAEDSQFGIGPEPKASNPWRLFAQFLWAGRVYE